MGYVSGGSMDLEDMSSEELTELQDAVRAEQDRRYQRAAFPQQITSVIEAAIKAGVPVDELRSATDAALDSEPTA